MSGNSWYPPPGPSTPPGQPPPGWTPPPGWAPPPAAPGAGWAAPARPGDARGRAQAGRPAAAAARHQRHVRRGVPHHPLQPQGDRGVRRAGGGRGDGHPRRRHRPADLDRRPLARPVRERHVRGGPRGHHRRVRLARPRQHAAVDRPGAGHRDDRPRDHGRRDRQEAHAGRGVAGDARQALAADRSHAAPGTDAGRAHRRVRTVVGAGGDAAGRLAGRASTASSRHRCSCASWCGSGSGSTTCRCRP